MKNVGASASLVDHRRVDSTRIVVNGGPCSPPSHLPAQPSGTRPRGSQLPVSVCGTGLQIVHLHRPVGIDPLPCGIRETGYFIASVYAEPAMETPSPHRGRYHSRCGSHTWPQQHAWGCMRPARLPLRLGSSWAVEWQEPADLQATIPGIPAVVRSDPHRSKRGVSNDVGAGAARHFWCP